MPGAAHPILDTWAPPQYVFGTSGGAGPVRSPEGDDSMNTASSGQDYDTQLHFKLAGAIALGLLIVFGLQALGFKFVVAGSIGG